jgi:maltose-binding protein MalE
VFDNQSDIFAKVPVLGRALGPVLQSIGTVTEKRQTLIIEAVMPASNGSGYALPPNTNALVLYYAPAFLSKLFKSKDTENWNDVTGRYSRQVEWTYE